jgi:hypothetical protein
MRKPNGYQPNLNYPKTVKKIKEAVGFVTMMLPSSGKPRQLAKTAIDQRLGRSSNDLGRWLRSKLLVDVSIDWSWRGTQGTEVKHYKLNKRGLEEVLNILHNKQHKPDTPTTTQIVHDECRDQFCHANLPMNEFIDCNFQLEYKSERRYSPFQNINKSERARLFNRHGFTYDYDIDAAAPTLLLQYARMNGFHKPTPHYDQLLNDKHKVRQYISKILEIPLDSAKQLINALINGAKIGADNQYRTYSTFDLLNRDRARVQMATGRDPSLPFDKYLVGLRLEISLMWSHISSLNLHEVNYDSAGRRKAMSPKQKATLYRQLETQVGDVVANYLKQDFIQNPMFPIHDGFMTKYQVDTTELSQYIKRHTGFEVKFTQQLLTQLQNSHCVTGSVNEEDTSAIAPVSFSSFTTKHLNNIDVLTPSHGLPSSTHYTYNNFSNNHKVLTEPDKTTKIQELMTILLTKRKQYGTNKRTPR